MLGTCLANMTILLFMHQQAFLSARQWDLASVFCLVLNIRLYGCESVTQDYLAPSPTYSFGLILSGLNLAIVCCRNAVCVEHAHLRRYVLP